MLYCVHLSITIHSCWIVNGWLAVARFGVNFPICWAMPMNLRNSVMLVGVLKSVIAAILFGNGVMPSFDKWYPRNSTLD